MRASPRAASERSVLSSTARCSVEPARSARVQVGAGEIGLGEIGAREVGAEEVGVGEERATQVRAGEAHVGEFHAREVGARAVGPSLSSQRAWSARIRAIASRSGFSPFAVPPAGFDIAQLPFPRSHAPAPHRVLTPNVAIQ